MGQVFIVKIVKWNYFRLFRHDGGSQFPESLDFTGIAQNRFCEISVG